MTVTQSLTNDASRFDALNPVAAEADRLSLQDVSVLPILLVACCLKGTTSKKCLWVMFPNKKRLGVKLVPKIYRHMSGK